jgi:hypothetical protein
MAKQKNAGEVTIKKLEMVSSTGRYNLIPHLVEMSVYENIYRPAIGANIVLSDSVNISYNLPIVGQEVVDIDISISGFTGQRDEDNLSIKPPPLHVNSVKGRFFSKPKAQVFTLELFSEQYMSSTHSKVSKSYRNTKISSMVSDIYYTYLHENKAEFYVEPTDGNESIVIPNLSPTDAIRWLAKRAIPKQSNGVNYVFFETMRGSQFVSIDSLAAQEPIFKYELRPRTDDPSGLENLSIGTQKIASLKFVNQFDKIKNTRKGIYASKLITHDIVSKKIVQHEYKGFGEFFAMNHFGTYPPLANSDMEMKSARVNRTIFAPGNKLNNFQTTRGKTLSDMVDSKVQFYPKHNQMYSKNINDTYDNKVENWKLQRNGNYGMYDGITLHLEVSGNSALKVGAAITVIVPSPEVTDGDKKSDAGIDKFLSGTYMVTAIQHIFAAIDNTDPNVTYTMEVEVVKDALEDMVEPKKSRKED